MRTIFGPWLAEAKEVKRRTGISLRKVFMVVRAGKRGGNILAGDLWLAGENGLKFGGSAMGLWGVEGDAGIFLVGELGIEGVGKRLFEGRVSGILGEVGEFVSVLGGVVEFFGWSVEKAFDKFA